MTAEVISNQTEVPLIGNPVNHEMAMATFVGETARLAFGKLRDAIVSLWRRPVVEAAQYSQISFRRSDPHGVTVSESGFVYRNRRPLQGPSRILIGRGV